MIHCKRLISNSEIRNFEMLQFLVFSEKKPDNWLCKNYSLVNGVAYRSTIPYDDQYIYAAIQNDNIIGAIAINLNLRKQLQLEQIGFCRKIVIPSSIGNFGEVLSIFRSSDSKLVYLQWWKPLFKYLKKCLNEMGIRFLLSTCSEDILPLYKAQGCKVIKSKIINNEVKHLIKLDIISNNCEFVLEKIFH